MSTHRTLTLAASALAAAAVLSGCSSRNVPPGESITAIRGNLTPELMTLWQTQDDVDNRIAITSDENWLMFTQDLGRAFFFDKPSRLTPEPIAY